MNDLPAKTTKKQGFQPGKSGNPKGRPHGSRNTVTLAVEGLLDGQADVLTQKAVEMALEGDMQALRLCLERICPPRKSRPVQIELPKVETAHDVTKAHAVVISAMSTGALTPDEANIISSLLDTKRRAIETVELETRIEELEKEHS